MDVWDFLPCTRQGRLGFPSMCETLAFADSGLQYSNECNYRSYSKIHDTVTAKG